MLGFLGTVCTGEAVIGQLKELGAGAGRCRSLSWVPVWRRGSVLVGQVVPQ